MFPPESFFLGDYVTWDVSLPDYPNVDSWELSYAFVRSDGQVLVSEAATGSVDDAGSGEWTVILLPADTALFTIASGDTKETRYAWIEYVEKAAGAERTQLRSGVLTARASLVAASGGLDTRSHVKTTLDALEAMIAGKASKDQISYAIAGRSLSRMQPGELLEWRDHYRAEYANEVAKDRIARGLGNPSVIKARFPVNY